MDNSLEKQVRSHTLDAAKLTRFHYWSLCHLRALLYSIGELFRAPVASLMTIAVIGIAITLPAGLFVLLQNLQGVSHNWQHQPRITLYLKTNAQQANTQKLIQNLKANTDIGSVEYISPQQGLSQFSKVGAFAAALQELPENPLPAVIVVKPSSLNPTPASVALLYSKLKQLPAVDIAQLNLNWIKRVYYLLSLGKRFTYGLALLFGIAVMLIVGNTIRLVVQRHRQELTVLRLIGATPAFIRRPFLYRGVFYGIIGGMLAWILISIMILWLKGPTAALASTYKQTFILNGLNIQDGIALIVFCALLSFIGTWFALRQHLNMHEQI